MNFQDRSSNRGGGRGRGSFRSNFRSNFGRGGPNNRHTGHSGHANNDDRPSPWKDNDRFENRNSGGFRGNSNSGPSVGGFNDNRDSAKDSRDFQTNRDARPAGNTNVRPLLTENKRNEPPKATLAPTAPQPVSNNQRTNDVEIIVTHKLLTEYAELIERRLKTVGLSVDLLFPNEEVPLDRVLGNIASRGTLYALVVTQLNEQHKSVIVNILYGQTQEHRNMPLDDAVTMIMKNFEAYMKGERSAVVPPPGAVPVSAAGIPLGDKHPEVIQSLLNILVENRPLTVPQYEKVITYLSERKDHLVGNEIGSAISSKSSDSAPQNTKAQLQNRILNILASSDSKVNLLEKSSGSLSSSQTTNPSFLKDSPTLKALQSIVQNNLFGSRI